MQETPIVKIKPNSARLNLDLKDLWIYRELLYFLTLRDVRVRYKQTAIGVLWAILQPVLTTAIFTVIFSQFARFESLQIPYPLFALSGLLLWLFVNTSITTASNSLVSNTNLVTKIYFPRLIVPIAATLSGLIDLALGFLLLIGLMIYYGVELTWQIVFAPVFIVLAITLRASFGTLFAALNVRFRDVKFALPFASANLDVHLARLLSGEHFVGKMARRFRLQSADGNSRRLARRAFRRRIRLVRRRRFGCSDDYFVVFIAVRVQTNGRRFRGFNLIHYLTIIRFYSITFCSCVAVPFIYLKNRLFEIKSF
jgi:hypothetical protein